MMGVSTEDGRGNITAYAGVRDNEEVLQADRDYSACSLNANPTRRRSPAAARRQASRAISIPRGGVIRRIHRSTQTTGNTFRPFNDDTDLYNFGPANYYQRPDTRYTLGAMGHYELTEYADVYTQLMFSDYESIAQIAPGGDFFDTNTINCDNPILSAAAARHDRLHADGDRRRATIVPLYIARRNVEGGGRQDSVREQLVPRLAGCSRRDLRKLGLRRVGAVLEGQGRPVDQQLLPHAASDAALDVDQGSGRRATPACRRHSVCRSASTGRSELRPLQSIHDRRRDARRSPTCRCPASSRARSSRRSTRASMTGDLGGNGMQSPFASESIKVAFGVEKRFDRLDNVTDDPLATCLLSGYGRPDDRHRRAPPRCSICSPKCGCRWCRTRRSRISSGWSWRIATPTTIRSRPTRTRSAWTGRRSRTCGSAAAISVRFARRTSSSCSPRRASTCSTCRVTRAART